MPNSDTKERIFEAAERLLVDRGFAGTSLRAVTGEARVNLAAVHYHFGSKEGLLRAVLKRRLGPINQSRLKRLDRLEAAVGEAPPSLEGVLDSFLRPLLVPERGLAGDGLRARRLIGRLYAEPRDLVRPLLRDELEPARLRFFAALERALPGLPADELRWRFQLVVGAIVHVLSGQAELGGTPDPGGDPSDTLQRMVDFLAAGLRVPCRTREGSRCD